MENDFIISSNNNQENFYPIINKKQMLLDWINTIDEPHCLIVNEIKDLFNGRVLIELLRHLLKLKNAKNLLSELNLRLNLIKNNNPYHILFISIDFFSKICDNENAFYLSNLKQDINNFFQDESYFIDLISIIKNIYDDYYNTQIQYPEKDNNENLNNLNNNIENNYIQGNYNNQNNLKNNNINNNYNKSNKIEVNKSNIPKYNFNKDIINIKNNNNNLNNLIINNNILNNDNYDNNYINENNQIEYGKIFGLLNNEIKEITDLFKRTQSVDQQKNNYQEINFFNLQGLEEISTNLFEKQNENENEKFEKMIDISQLENEEEEISVNRNKSQSILFSSYNSEFYKNLNNMHKYNNNDEGEENYNNDYTNLSASSLKNNIIQIAKNNIILQEEEKNFNQNNGKDNSIINDDNKTKCQFVDVDFNNNFEEKEIGNSNDCNYNYNNDNILDGIDSENTNTIMDEINNVNNVSKNIPIQEIIQKIRDN